MTEVSRRLSFGSSKSCFSLEKYSRVLETEENRYQFQNTMEDIPSGIGNLEEMKEYFKLLKKHYIQLYTKQGFLEKVSKDEWDAETTQTILGSKSEYENSKRKLSALQEEIKNLSNSLLDLYEKVDQEGKQLKTEVENHARHVKALAEEENTIDNFQLKFQNEKENEAPAEQEHQVNTESSSPAWFQEATKLLSNLSGIQIVSHTSRSVCFRLGTHMIDVLYDENEQINFVKVNPHDNASIDEIVEFAKETNDAQFLLRELQLLFLKN